MEAAKQKLLEQTHQTILKVGFESNDYKIVADLTSPKFVAFGTALDEKIFGLKDLKALLKHQKEQAKGIDIKLNVNNLYTHISEDENTAVYIDEVILAITNDGESIDMLLRLSVVLEYIEDKWMMVHFHSSKPEHVESDKDTWGIETWKAKAEQLEKEVAERTADLVLKNKELEIESALERVRSVSMAMQKSTEMQEVANAIYQQMKSLGLEIHVIGMSGEIQPDSPYEVWVGGSSFTKPLQIPYTDSTEIQRQYNKAIAERPELYQGTFSGEVKKEYIDFLISESDIPKPLKKLMQESSAKTTSISFSQNSSIQIVRYTEVPYSEEDNSILVRFAKVFNQAYIRFLDLQKAEAQAREAQIEAALEKVRSRTMAMQSSDELPEAANTLFLEVQALGIPAWSCGYNILDEDQKSCICIMSSEGELQTPFVLPLSQHESLIPWYNSIKNNDAFFVYSQEGKDLVAHYDYMRSLPDLKETFETFEKIGLELPTQQFNHLVRFNEGFLLFITYEAVPEAHDIFKRFGKVFEQTYTRFLDLKKAEAQVREAQIEASLERVRSKSIGMQKSKELANVVLLLDEELNGLGIEVHGTQIITDFDNREKNINVWFGRKGLDYLERFHVPYFDHPIRKKFYNARKKGVDFYVDQYSKTVKNGFFKLLIQNSDFRKIPKERQQFIFDSPGLTRASVLLKNSILIFQRYNISEFLEEEIAIFKRFSKVFEQAYTRFLDLQKAEAQAREAQIAAALERVRSQSMGMQSTSDFGAVTTEMFTQLRNFGEELFATGIVFCDKHEGHVEQWHSIPGAGMVSPFIVPIDLDYIHQYRYDQWKKGEELFSIEIPSDFIEQHFQDIFDLPSAQIALKDLESRNAPMPEAPPYEIDYGASFEHGYVLISSLKPLENTDILIRFTKVFEQAYTRFLDLKKAEAQAREAQIEASLERVRAKAMSMQNSDELDEVLSVLCEQFDVLDIVPISTHMTVLDLDNNNFTFRETGKFGNRSLGEQIVDLNAMDNWKETVDKWKADKASSINKLHFPKEQLPEVWNVFHESFASMPEGSRITPEDYPDGIYHTAGKHPFGYIGMNQARPSTEEEEQIVIKFANEFGRAYQRFLDLQKAEAQARESQIEAALEKIRSRSLAMQSPDELQEVVALVAEKLKELGVIFDAGGVILCTYFPDNKDVVHWIAVDDFSTSGRYLVSYFDNPIYSEAWDSKIRGDTYFSKEFPVEAKNHFFKHAFEHSDYKHMPEDYKDFVLKSEQHRLSAAWSKNSAILIPSLTGAVPSESDAEIMKRFANVFEHAYIRFMDLQEKEQQAKALFDEKQRLEKTLTDLQTTQKQLIQSEKMASLGELTAGIAHEIQNPLNFVNNFSEVSKELLEEMQVEMENGDFEEVKAIMADVIQNLEKINHHGQRADGIVKGMLQHSRASGDKKEPTDINKLADEYMRLAYHGLRAKNKQFNATLETDFDQSLPKTPIIPQDIGRVILNLFTNAFFAVEEKKTSSNDDGYEPTVSVSTKQKKDSIEITVKDNGNGIPEHIKDKIFQPFFTTKPTGQGTGLGLSMSYDIITKGHGGDISLQTKQNEGTSFIIKLPIK